MKKIQYGFVYNILDKKTKKILIKKNFYNKKYNIIQVKSTFILAHDQNNIAKKNDFVKLYFSRKLSKNKFFIIKNII